MPSAICGWCGVLANMPFVENPVSQWWGPDVGETRVMALHKCDSCSARSISYALLLDDEIPENGGDFGDSTTAIHEHRYADNSDQLRWYPPSRTSSSYPHSPRAVAAAAMEAWKCLSFEAFRASAQLARSVVEATAKDKGITRGNLAAKIDELHARDHIREFVRKGAHEIRFLGNDMAHGDFAAPVTVKEAKQSLLLMDLVLDEVYEGPGKAADAEALREARKQANP